MSNNEIKVIQMGYMSIDKDTPKGIPLDTLVCDENSICNIQPLIHHRGLWFLNNMSMYVYYTPTHWKHIESPDKAR